MADLAERFTIVFHNAEPSDAVRQRGVQLLDKLARYFPAIMHGTMTIEGTHRHHHQGNIYHVSLRLHLPGGDALVSREPERNHAHEDVYVAMRDACDAAKRQLEALVRSRGGKGAQHEQERFNNRPEQEENL